MSRFKSRCAALLVGVVCAGWLATATALDPLVLLLLRMVRDSAISNAIERGAAAAEEKRPEDLAASLPRLAALPPTEGQWVRSLIDESFVHLSSQQRDELYASLLRMLNDPRHAEVRSTILAEFTGQAVAMRDAQRRLAGLTPDQMKSLAVEARREYERLPPQQRKEMLQVLQHGIPGMPSTLNDLILAEFSSAAPPR